MPACLSLDLSGLRQVRVRRDDHDLTDDGTPAVEQRSVLSGGPEAMVLVLRVLVDKLPEVAAPRLEVVERRLRTLYWIAEQHDECRARDALRRVDTEQRLQRPAVWEEVIGRGIEARRLLTA